MLAAALVDPVHDGDDHLWLSHCHLLLSAGNVSLGSGGSLIITIIGPSEVRAPAVGIAHAGGERSGLY